ncbi:MAG: hypothetical protein NT117_01835 [Gammaproteobacteria bacterium]|nr:hypothetical protein [Gammaproteobacteria bacterium]
MKSTQFLVPRTLLSTLIAALLVPATAMAAVGPSTSATPYLTPIDSSVEFTSVLSVGDSVKRKNKGNESYRMSGIPDGLGAFDNGDGTITVLMAHELGAGVGVVRTHGAKGAFVSKWQVRKSDLKVLNGDDLINTVKLWDGSAYVATPAVAFNRFCSADLAQTTAFFNSSTGKGFNEGRIFLNGEETTGGRGFAHIAAGRQHGTTYELPGVGKAAWENLLASPYPQDLTIVAGMDDGALNASKLYFYLGEKQAKGGPIELAGLANGANFQVSIDGYATESGVNPIPHGYVGNFSLVDTGGTGLNRVEDGAWDTQNPNRFYFVTTANFTGNTRLWRMTFADIHNPLAGGTIEVLIDGELTGQRMLDNLAVDGAGDVILQEDVGNQVHLGKVWKYHAATRVTTVLAQHDATRFISGAAADIDGSDAKQSDEESSGIVEVSGLFAGTPGYDTSSYRYFLLDVQAHHGSINGVALPSDLVEGGQLLLMKQAR